MTSAPKGLNSVGCIEAGELLAQSAQAPFGEFQRAKEFLHVAAITSLLDRIGKQAVAHHVALRAHALWGQVSKGTIVVVLGNQVGDVDFSHACVLVRFGGFASFLLKSIPHQMLAIKSRRAHAGWGSGSINSTPSSSGQ